MASVILTKEQHLIFTNRWREAIKLGTNYSTLTLGEILDIAKKKVYYDAPELMDALLVDLAANLKGK